MKNCALCKIELNELNCRFKDKNKLYKHSYCKKCLYERQMDRWIQRKIWAIEYKGGKCFDCQSMFSYVVYDFHHLNPDDKSYDWNQMRLLSKETMIKELDKCVLLCSNCHRMRHHLSKTPIEKKATVEKICKCGKKIGKRSELCKTCYNSNIKQKINWPTKEELEKLVWEKSTLQLSIILGVSDKAIEKRCKKLQITKPPRGYWSKYGQQDSNLP